MWEALGSSISSDSCRWLPDSQETPSEPRWAPLWSAAGWQAHLHTLSLPPCSLSSTVLKRDEIPEVFSPTVNSHFRLIFNDLLNVSSVSWILQRYHRITLWPSVLIITLLYMSACPWLRPHFLPMIKPVPCVVSLSLWMNEGRLSSRPLEICAAVRTETL